MSIFKNSIFITVLKIINNQKYFNKNYTKFFYFPNIYFLTIKNCSFNGTSSWILTKKLPFLQYLDISINPIYSLEFLQKIHSKNLQYLDISFTKIQFISINDFRQFKFLKTLLITNCFLKNVDENFLENNEKLLNLYLNNTLIKNEIENMKIGKIKEILNVHK